MGKGTRMGWFEDHWEMLLAFGGLAASGLKGFLHLRDTVNDARKDHTALAKEHGELKLDVKELMQEVKQDLKAVHDRVTDAAKATSRIEGMLAARPRQ